MMDYNRIVKVFFGIVVLGVLLFLLVAGTFSDLFAESVGL
jgi:hypothetical protein